MADLYRSIVVLLGDSIEGGQLAQLVKDILHRKEVAGLSLEKDSVDETLANDRKVVGELTEHVPMKHWPEFVGRYYAALMDKALGFEDEDDKDDEKVRIHVRQGINWDEQPLGKIPDVELAKKLGVSNVAVGRARRRRKIPVFNHRGGCYRPQGCRAGVDWDEQPLGMEADVDIATRLGVDRSSVRSARLVRGIPAPNDPDSSLRIGRLSKQKAVPAKGKDKGLRIRRRKEGVVDEPMPKEPHVHRCPICRQDTPCEDRSCEPILDNEDGAPMIYKTCKKCVAELAKELNDGIVPINSPSSIFGPIGRFR